MTVLMPDRSLWLDIETTGIEPEFHEILEIGLVVADECLQPVAALSVVLRPPEFLVMDPVVVEMHQKNGLLADCESRGLAHSDAREVAYGFLDEHFPGTDPILGGGSGIDRFDLPFLRAHQFSWIADRIHFRTYDLSGVKALMPCAGLDSEVYFDRRANEGLMTSSTGVTGPDVPHRGVADALDALYFARNLARLLWQGSH